jgi:hypothetical protein
MVGVPALLLGIGYISLHTELVFIDLHLSAGLALLFLAVLKFWYFLRKKHWCGDLPAETPAPAVWSWESSEPWSDDQLDRLMMALQKSAPDCRLLLLDLSPSDRLWVSWRPFSSCLALIGPAETLRQAQALLLGSVRDAHVRCAEIEPLESETPAQDVHRRMTQLALQGWSSLQRTVTHSTQHKL